MTVKLYTTNCPQCRFLETALKQKGIAPEIVYGADKIRELGYESAPVLQIDNETMRFPEAVRWLNQYTVVSDGGGGVPRVC